MSNQITLKKSSVSGKVPLPADLEYGELALNYADGKLYFKKSDGTTIDYFQVGAGGGGGGASITVSDTAPSSPTAGALWWDSTIGQLRLYYNDGDTSQWVDAVNTQGIAGNNGANGVNGKTLLNGTVNPTTEGVDGDFYINTTTKFIFGPKASGVWPSGVSIVGNALVTVSDTAPTASPGVIWFDSTVGQLFVYYDDGSSAQWVGVANDPGQDGIGVPAGGSAGQALVKNTGADYDTIWVNVITSSGITPVAGKFNTSTTAPTNTTRLNYEGDFYATNLNGALVASNITASGTKDATTFLRGDNSWAVPVGVVAIKETTYVTGSGTFTADPKALFTNIICTGGGGGGGGVDWVSGYGAGGGGGAGGTSIAWFTQAEMGANAAYAVGAAGTAGAAATGGTGGTGGASTFNPIGTGATLTGSGGVGGTGAGSTANTVPIVFAGGTGGAASSGDINREGGNGAAGMAMSATFMASGAGGMSYWGSGAKSVVLTTAGSSAGTTATSNGDGGSGACNSNNTAGVAGGAGAIGKIYIVEYLTA